VSLDQELFEDVLARAGVGDADARTDVELHVADDERVGEGHPHPLRKQIGVRRVMQVLAQEHELVTE
jgi:hypothetical protein